MSQWGKTFTHKTIYSDGQVLLVRMASHVDTGPDPFAPSTPDSIVNAILVIHAEGNQILIDKVAAAARDKFVGQPYRDWLELCGRTEQCSE